MKTLNEIKKKYKEEIANEYEKNDFLLPIYNELQLYSHKPKITRRELNAIMKKLNLPKDTYYYVNQYGSYTLYLRYNKHKESLQITEYKKYPEDTQTTSLIRGTLRSITLDHIEKLKKELEQLPKIYDEYKKAVTILQHIESPMPNLKNIVTLRNERMFHEHHSYFLMKLLPLLNDNEVRF